jgi:hypothetical protein
LSAEAWWYLAATLLGSIVWILPHLLDPRQVPDRGDPVFSAWRLATFAHQLATDPARLFDGNIFHPLPLTLTYSDPTILQGVIGAWPIMSGADPLTIANLLMLAAFPACGLAFFHGGWRLTGDPRAAFVTGLLGAWMPFHGEHYSHLELQWFMFVPLAIVATLRALADPRWRTGVLAGAAIGAQWLASMYLGLMLVSILACLAIVAGIGWRVAPSRRLVTAAAGLACTCLPAFALTGVPYMMSRDARGDRGAEEVLQGSARVSDYASTHRRLATYQWRNRLGNVPERELFPGASPVLLAAAGVLPPFSTVTAALVASGALAFEWSRGLRGWTYPALYRWLPPYRGIRVPARFSAILGSVLALLAAFGTHRLLDRIRRERVRTAGALALGLLVLVDLRLTTTLVAYWPEMPTIYRSVTADMVLAEMPASRPIDYMYFSTRHHAPLLGGYSGYIPDDSVLSDAIGAFPAPSAIEALKRRGATHLTYTCAFERSETRCRHTLEQLRANPQIDLVSSGRWLDAEVRLYRLR